MVAPGVARDGNCRRKAIRGDLHGRAVSPVLMGYDGCKRPGSYCVPGWKRFPADEKLAASIVEARTRSLRCGLQNFDIDAGLTERLDGQRPSLACAGVVCSG